MHNRGWLLRKVGAYASTHSNVVEAEYQLEILLRLYSLVQDFCYDEVFSPAIFCSVDGCCPLVEQRSILDLDRMQSPKWIAAGSFGSGSLASALLAAGDSWLASFRSL